MKKVKTLPVPVFTTIAQVEASLAAEAPTTEALHANFQGYLVLAIDLAIDKNQLALLNKLIKVATTRKYNLSDLRAYITTWVKGITFKDGKFEKTGKIELRAAPSVRWDKFVKPKNTEVTRLTSVRVLDKYIDTAADKPLTEVSLDYHVAAMLIKEFKDSKAFQNKFDKLKTELSK